MAGGPPPSSRVASRPRPQHARCDRAGDRQNGARRGAGTAPGVPSLALPGSGESAEQGDPLVPAAAARCPGLRPGRRSLGDDGGEARGLGRTMARRSHRAAAGAAAPAVPRGSRRAGMAGSGRRHFRGHVGRAQGPHRARIRQPRASRSAGGPEGAAGEPPGAPGRVRVALGMALAAPRHAGVHPGQASRGREGGRTPSLGDPRLGAASQASRNRMV